MPMCDVNLEFPDLVLRVSDEEGRMIEGMIAPWDRPASVLKPIPGWESFKRGAFARSLTEGQRPIPLLVRHSEAEPAAVIVDHDDREDGQYAVFRALRTRAGDDALELIREGIYLGLSVGGWAIPSRTTIRRGVGGRQLIERSEMRLDHVGLVRNPAYADAQVLALRSEEFAEYDHVAAAQARRRLRARLARLTTT